MKFPWSLLRVPPWLAAVLGFILLVPAISWQSLDLEESQTWNYARLPSASEVWENLQSDRNIEAQMPLGMVAAWVWSRPFGTGEFSMRSLNLLWLAMALFAMTLVARETGIRWLPFLFAIQPFVWYSMDFARPAIMEMAGGSLLLAGTLRLLNRPDHWLKIALPLSFGAIILCGANIYGVVPMIVVMALLVGTAAWRRLLMSRGSKVFLFGASGFLILLAAYYLSTVIRGAGGVKLWAVTPLNLFIVAYEFLGFTGLGPGRQDFREILRGAAPVSELWAHVLGWLALAVAYGVVTVVAVKSWLTRAECGPRTPPFRLWLLCAMTPVISAFLFFCLAVANGTPFWERHLAGTLPFAVTSLSVVLYWATQGIWRRAGRWGVCAVVLLLILSSVLVRILPRHGHDDYRAAAKAALGAASGTGVVWWVAGESGGRFYGVNFVPEGPGIQLAPNRIDMPVVVPELLLISRPENFDIHRIAERLIRSGSYRKVADFQAFEVWEIAKP